MKDAKRVVDTTTVARPNTPENGTTTTFATSLGEWWEVKIRGHKLAAMWSMTAILGMVFISTTTGIPRLLIPVVLLATYAWYGNKHVESAGDLVALRTARVGQLADSLYFLGFLWTLYALIDSFVFHEMSIAEAVFRAFGYALVTTAMGMFLRLLLLQFGYSEEDQVQLGGLTVEEEIARFSKEVRNAVDSISRVRKQTDAALTKWIDSLNNSTDALKTSVDDVKEQTVGLKEALVELHQANAKHLDELVKTALSQFVQKVAPSLEELNNANSQFVMQVNASTTNVETVASKGVKDIKASVQAGTSGISTSLEKSSQTIERATATFATTLQAQMTDLELSLANVSKQIREIHVPPDIVEKTVAEQLATANAHLEESTKAFQKAIIDLSKQIREIRVPPDIIEKAVEGQLATVNAHLEESTKAFQKAITDLSKQIHEIRVPPDIVEETVAQQVTTATASLVGNTRSLEEAINKLEKSVLTTAEQVHITHSKPWWKFGA
jgi:esterase/lipase